MNIAKPLPWYWTILLKLYKFILKSFRGVNEKGLSNEERGEECGNVGE